MTGNHHIGRKWHTCPACQKHSFPSKRDAKTALRNNPYKAGMCVYRCTDSGMWHFGHHRGRTRDQIRNGTRRTA